VSSLVKVDEDLPHDVAELAAKRGFDVKTVVGQGWQGFEDSQIWKRIQIEGRWLITGDKGFADLRVYPPGSHAGVILLRPYEESRRAYVELMEDALDEVDLKINAGATIVVTDHGVRIRRAEKL
jgi:predicted nuclease of predicted toxin-antitoxin system